MAKGRIGAPQVNPEWPRESLTPRDIDRLGRQAGRMIDAMPDDVVGESPAGQALRDEAIIALELEVVAMTETPEVFPEGINE